MLALRRLVALLATVPLMAQIVPRPRQFEPGSATCRGAEIRCDVAAFRPQLEALAAALGKLGAEASVVAGTGTATIVVERGEVGGAEGYRITTRDSVLAITAEAPVGVAHAAATLLQLVRIVEGRAEWSGVQIEDRPDLPFRCFMVDMGRVPHDPGTLRQVVDAMWFYKVNYLHLHLSDDQLCSWPSELFPRLYSASAGWTRDDFVALEAYSQARGVTIVPEFDVPGHSTILRREYPEVFGKEPTDLASLPEAQRGVEALIAEVLGVFAATPYVHLGGDEAYGVPGDIQRDFINRLNAFVKAQGRRAIVWEGPSLGAGEHKVATDVLHMNWNTVDFPAQQMLDAGYEVVNAAWDPLYIVDHYPQTMFTGVAVERCYAFDLQAFGHVDPGMPTFATPHRTTTAQGIVGFCMPWWEGRPHNLVPLCIPRLAAVASAAWNRAGERDFADFDRRQQLLLPRYERLSGAALAVLPVADAATQAGNLAFLARVTPSAGASQPMFGPDRLTNGLSDRFDHFLGYPTAPEPLEIVIELAKARSIGRVVVHETAVGDSHEVYELAASLDGTDYERVGSAGAGTRGAQSFVEHVFPPRPVRFLKITTRGCHGLTFPSFSRLTEVMAFSK